MRLSPDSRVYIRFDITMPITDTVPTAVSVDFGGQWTELTFVSWESTNMRVAGQTVEATTSHWQVLVAGPNAVGADAIVLPYRRTSTRIQVTTGDEIIVRAADPIDVA